MRWEVWGWVMVTGLHTVSIHHLHHHTPITPELWPRPSFIYTFSETGAPWLQYIIFILSPWPLVAPVSRGQRLATVMSWVGSGPGLCWGKQSIHYLVCHYCHSPRHQPQQQTTSPGASSDLTAYSSYKTFSLYKHICGFNGSLVYGFKVMLVPLIIVKMFPHGGQINVSGVHK